MKWVEFSDNNIMLVNNQMKDASYNIFVTNLTQNISSNVIRYIPDKQYRKSNFPMAIVFHQGLNKVVIRSNSYNYDTQLQNIKASDDNTEVIYFYKPNSAGTKFDVVVEGKPVTDSGKLNDPLPRRLMLRIHSAVELPPERISYSIGNYPFHFNFSKIEADKDAYFVIKYPNEGIKFRVEDFEVPKRASRYPETAEKLEYGIKLRYVELDLVTVKNREN